MIILSLRRDYFVWRCFVCHFSLHNDQILLVESPLFWNDWENDNESHEDAESKKTDNHPSIPRHRKIGVSFMFVVQPKGFIVTLWYSNDSYLLIFVIIDCDCIWVSTWESFLFFKCCSLGIIDKHFSCEIIGTHVNCKFKFDFWKWIVWWIEIKYTNTIDTDCCCSSCVVIITSAIWIVKRIGSFTIRWVRSHCLTESINSIVRIWRRIDTCAITITIRVLWRSTTFSSRRSYINTCTYTSVISVGNACSTLSRIIKWSLREIERQQED
mgnify:CR=1 FL=1